MLSDRDDEGEARGLFVGAGLHVVDRRRAEQEVRVAAVVGADGDHAHLRGDRALRRGRSRRACSVVIALRVAEQSLGRLTTTFSAASVRRDRRARIWSAGPGARRPGWSRSRLRRIRSAGSRGRARRRPSRPPRSRGRRRPRGERASLAVLVAEHFAASLLASFAAWDRRFACSRSFAAPGAGPWRAIALRAAGACLPGVSRTWPCSRACPRRTSACHVAEVALERADRHRRRRLTAGAVALVGGLAGTGAGNVQEAAIFAGVVDLHRGRRSRPPERGSAG